MRHLVSLFVGALFLLSVCYAQQDTTPPASVVFNFDGVSKAILAGDEFRRQLAELLDVPISDVIVVRYTATTSTVVLCAGDVAGLVQDVENQSSNIVGTLLEGAQVMLVIYGVPCEGGPAPLPPPPVAETTAYTSQTSDYGRTSVISSFEFDPTQTSFDFPVQTLPPWQRSSYVFGETQNDASCLSFSFFTLALLSLLAWAF